MKVEYTTVIAFFWEKTNNMNYFKICYICKNLYRQEIVYIFNIQILLGLGMPCT